MRIALWVVQAILALVFLAAGGMKLSQPIAKLEPRMAWVKSVGTMGVRTIGLLELLGAIGLILPGLLTIAPVLTPLAATGLGIIMVGAIVVHVRLKEAAVMPPVIVLLVLCAFVAWGRFGPYPFS